MKFFAIPLLLGILVFVAGIIGKPVYAAVFSGHVGKSGMPWNAGSWINGSSDHMQNYIDLMGHEPDSVTQGMGDVVTWPNVGGADSEAETDRDFNRTPAAWNADPPLFHGVFQDEGWFRHIWGDYPATVHRKRIIHLDWAEPIPSTLGNRWTGSTYANPTIYRDIKNGDADKYLFLLGRKFAYLDQRDGDPAFPMTMDWFYEFTLETHGKSPEGSYTDATGKHFTYQDFPYAWARWIRVFKEGYKYQRGQYPNYYFAFRPQLQFINSDRRGGGSTIRHEQLWPNNVASWSPGTRIINGITVLPPGPIGKQIDFVGASWHDSSMVRVQGESATAPGNNWNQILAGNAGFWGFNEIVAFARAQGVRMVFPEWAPRREGAAASTHPADVIRFTYAFFNANQDILDHEDYFDQGDGSIYSAWPANESGQDPIAVYKTLWRGDGHGTVGTAGTVTTGTGVGTTGGVATGVTSGGATVGTTFTVPSYGCTERYTNAATIPSGYGAAYNVFGGAKETLLNFACNTAGDATFSFETPDTATQKYVYKNGFRWTGAAWVPITFTGTPAPGTGGNWLLVGAHTTIENADLRSPSFYTFFAAYSCTFVGGAWKCGCRDSFCATNFWQLQAIINPIGGGGVVTGFFTTGTTGGTVGGTVGGTTGEPTIVATPTISPAGGTFTASQTVTLSVTTADATMHYTLDGSTPTEASAVYTAPITLTDTKTIKVGAWKTGLTPSAIASAVFTKGLATTKPNIVLIVTDDQDYASLSKMPKVKSLLVDQGVQFTNYIDNLSLCCPARTTLLTGMYAQNHGITKQSPPPASLATGFRESKALPVWLKNVGYTNAFYGKYFNFYGGADDYPASHVPPGWDEWNGVPRSGDHLIHSYYNYAINENGTIRNYGSNPSEYMTDVLTAKVLNFLESQRNTTSPFYIQLAYLAPHDDLTNTPTTDPIPAPRYMAAFSSEPLPRLPNFNEADMSDKPAFITSNQPLLTTVQIAAITQKYRKRLASLMSVDDGVESLIQKLQSIGKLSNTYILYLSDNGWYAGEHRIASGKESFFEESIRLPLVVRGPGVVHAVNTKLVSDVDIAPTIVDIADAHQTVTFDGRSLVPLLEGADPTWRTAVRMDGTLDYDPLIPGTPGFDAVRTTRYTYVEHDNNQKELYDLLIDPYELLNKAGTPAYTSVQADLATRLGQLRNCAGLNCWITAPDSIP